MSLTNATSHQASTLLVSSVGTIAAILAVMAIVALIEVVIPLRKRNRWNASHTGPNLTLTFITFATNIFFNLAVVLGLAWLQAQQLGFLNVVPFPPALNTVIVVLVLDFAFYVAHVAMHMVPPFWRVHSVHHSDPAVDVTTTIRQHPLEGIIRYAFIVVAAFPLGASPAAFAIYRSASALNALVEHANIGIPQWLDTSLSWITTWPNVHKIHHSRDRQFTDTNYGNLFSIWDRLFGTFTPSRLGADIDYGLSGADDPKVQTARALLAAPFRKTARTSGAAASVERKLTFGETGNAEEA